MKPKSERTALVTGANAGLGFESAAKLAEDGWGHIILACRSMEKAEAARALLVERVGKDPFGVLAVDTSEVGSAQKAAAQLKEQGSQVDFLLLNAGASKKDPTFNSEQIEITYSSTLVGHHVLTMQMIDDQTLTPTARIVIAGSEGARGNLPGMNVHDIAELAKQHYNGDLIATIEDLVRLKTPAQSKFVNMSEYVTAKAIVAWWAAGLAQRLPKGMVVNAVSPGAVLATSFARDANFMMRALMIPMMKMLGPILGMNGPIEDGVQRYIDAAEYDDSNTGHFYATAHRKKAVGPIGIQTWPSYLTDETLHEAGFNAVVKLTGVAFPA